MIRLPGSLQGRLMVLVPGLVAAVWLVAAAVTWFDVRHELDELLDSHLAQAAALLVVQQGLRVDGDDHSIDAPSLHRYAPKVAFQVFHDGKLALRSANAPTTPMVGLDLGSADGLSEGFRTADIAGTTWRLFSTRGRDSDVQVLVGEQLSSRAAILLAVLRSSLWPMAAGLPLLALAAGWAVRRGMAPLRRLGSTLAARQPQALEPVVVVDAPAELLPAVAALNRLFARIDALMAAERRFTADAAHELRTPIAAIRAQAQVALGEADAGDRSRALRATLAGCDRAARLIDQMLTLSRLEGGAAPALAQVELTALVRQVAADLAPKALDKRQAIEVDAGPPLPVRGDATLLEVMVRNLVDNAIRYSPPQARIGLYLDRADGAVRMRVEDSGPGLSEAQRQRLGERFFRVLGSAEDGSGLGWSIVRRIADLHQAALRVSRSATLGGLAVEVTWPAAG